MTTDTHRVLHTKLIIYTYGKIGYDRREPVKYYGMHFQEYLQIEVVDSWCNGSLTLQEQIQLVLVKFLLYEARELTLAKSITNLNTTLIIL